MIAENYENKKLKSFRIKNDGGKTFDANAPLNTWT